MINTPTRSSSLEQWLSYCERLHTQTIDLGLERAQQVRAKLGLNFSCPVITVAGTNGKGSTCAMLESILMAAGYKVGVFSSPHLVHFEERCRINRQDIEANQLVPHFAAVEDARQQAGVHSETVSLSYFEFTTLVILHCMCAQNLDVAILEVGLGGRLDATNIIDADCSVITCIDIDHTEFLGTDRETIALEKAGIMRAHKPAVVGDPSPPKSLAAYATQLQADLRQNGQDFKFTSDATRWSWQGRKLRFEKLPFPSLAGSNQLINGAGVLAALEALQEKLPVSEEHIRQGLTQTVLAGRFQIFSGKPTLVLDVGHNPHAAKALLQNLQLTSSYPKTHAIFGAMHDKDLRGILEVMDAAIDSWYFTDLPLPRAIRATELEALWKSLPHDKDKSLKSSCHQTPYNALLQALEEVDDADRIVIFGSFYTVGDILEHGVPSSITI